MLLDPRGLAKNLDRLEEIERAALRLVVQALVDYRREILKIFQAEDDFRVRLGFARLKQKPNWRVQHIPMPPYDFYWEQ